MGNVVLVWEANMHRKQKDVYTACQKIVNHDLDILTKDLHDKTLKILSSQLLPCIPFEIVQIIHGYLYNDWMDFEEMIQRNPLYRVKNMDLQWITSEYERRCDKSDMNFVEKMSWQTLRLWF